MTKADVAVLAAKSEEEKRILAEQNRAQYIARGKLAEHIVADTPREKMADLMFAAASRVAIDVLTGNVSIRNGTDAAAVINAAVAAGRLERGESTSNVEKTPPSERIARIQELQKVAEERKQEAVVQEEKLRIFKSADAG